ncbi:unnamed protein product [Clavelina lepadiformis]|uniref:Uncharacterized protein n=1 Tax=Clavelina lepadiformis TaxID=159417 RepID=A0ABP0GGK7_CLALP
MVSQRKFVVLKKAYQLQQTALTFSVFCIILMSIMAVYNMWKELYLRLGILNYERRIKAAEDKSELLGRNIILGGECATLKHKDFVTDFRYAVELYRWEGWACYCAQWGLNFEMDHIETANYSSQVFLYSSMTCETLRTCHAWLALANIFIALSWLTFYKYLCSKTRLKKRFASKKLEKILPTSFV